VAEVEHSLRGDPLEPRFQPRKGHRQHIDLKRPLVIKVATYVMPTTARISAYSALSALPPDDTDVILIAHRPASRLILVGI
jgi:hypothetical protein